MKASENDIYNNRSLCQGVLIKWRKKCKLLMKMKNSNFRRAVSQYMQESGSYINPYYGATGQNTFGNSGSDSPTATLALAAYYGSFGAGAGSTPGAGMAG